MFASSSSLHYHAYQFAICCSTGNTQNFGADLLETLLKMAPTKEEEIKLREFKEETSPIKLGPSEKFLKAVLDVPFAFKRVDAMLYIANFESEVKYLKNNFEILEVSNTVSTVGFNIIIFLSHPLYSPSLLGLSS